ncbi:MAG TPA: YceI family protein [Kofleriaceae bacterium]|nr:YceI family protein [Kofleriaceae bacterium]
MPVYTIDDRRSSVVVSARSNVHDTRAVWSRVTGTVEADPDDLAGGGAAVDLAVDMTRHDAGDFLRNRKLRKDLEVDRHPEARFRLSSLSQVAATGPGRFTARAEGVIAWRGREVPMAATGEGELSRDELAATARFELDVRAFGVEPPRFLMFKVEEIVAVEVTLVARAAG